MWQCASQKIRWILVVCCTLIYLFWTRGCPPISNIRNHQTTTEVRKRKAKKRRFKRGLQIKSGFALTAASCKSPNLWAKQTVATQSANRANNKLQPFRQILCKDEQKTGQHRISSVAGRHPPVSANASFAAWAGSLNPHLLLCSLMHITINQSAKKCTFRAQDR